MSGRPSDDRDRVLAVNVSGRIAPPRLQVDLSTIDDAGRLSLLPGHGGIAPGVHVGDRVADRIADHLMVGASIEDEGGEAAVAGPLHQLSCLGNRVRDAGGDMLGVVAGKRGGLAPGFMAPQLVSVEAPEARLERLVPGDRVVVEAVGRGLSLPDFPALALLNLSPDVLDALPLTASTEAIEVSVRDITPASTAGAGMGQDSWIGDVEIADPSHLRHRQDLRFGDLIAVTDMDGRVSRFPCPGWVSVGLVSHGPSPIPGHGIGLTLLISGPAAVLRVRRSPEGSLAAALLAECHQPHVPPSASQLDDAGSGTSAEEEDR